FQIDKPQEVTAEHLKAYMRNLEERGKYKNSATTESKNYPERRRDYGKKISNTTIANYVRNIKAFYSHLYSERIIRRNPMVSVKSVKPERKQKIMLEDNELKQFFRAFDVTKFDQYRDW